MHGLLVHSMYIKWKKVCLYINVFIIIFAFGLSYHCVYTYL